MSQKLLVNDSKQVEDISEFNEDFMKSYNKESDEGYFLEFDDQYPKIYIAFRMIYSSCMKEFNLKKLKNLQQTCMIKKSMLCP